MGRTAAWVLAAAAVAVAAAAAGPPARVASAGPGTPLAPRTADEIADAVLSSLNESVDPCVDVYEFACGGWRAANPPPPFGSDSDAARAMQSRVDVAVGALLRDDAMAASLPGVFYAACHNASRAVLDVAPLARLRPALRGLTAAPANGSIAAAVGAVAAVAAAGVDSIVIDVYILDDPKRADGMTVYVYEPDLTMAEDKFKGTTPYDVASQKAYKRFQLAMAETAVAAGLLQDDDTPGAAPVTPAAVVAAAAAFEAQMVQFAYGPDLTTASVKTKAGGVRWQPPPSGARHSALSRVLAQAPANNSAPIARQLVVAMAAAVGVTLPANVSVVEKGTYAAGLDGWLRAAVAPGGGGLQPLRAYMAVAAARRYAELDLLGTGPRAAVDAYDDTIYGTTAPTPRLRKCVSLTGHLFPTAVGRAFVAAHLPARLHRAALVGVAEEVRAAVDATLIGGATWMDAQTAAAARAKLRAMPIQMGEVIPAGGEEDKAGVVVSADDYPASFLSANAERWREEWVRAAGRANRYVHLRTICVSAFYSAFTNVAWLTPGTCGRRAAASGDAAVRLGVRLGCLGGVEWFEESSRSAPRRMGKRRGQRAGAVLSTASQCPSPSPRAPP